MKIKLSGELTTALERGEALMDERKRLRGLIAQTELELNSRRAELSRVLVDEAENIISGAAGMEGSRRVIDIQGRIALLEVAVPRLAAKIEETETALETADREIYDAWRAWTRQEFEGLARTYRLAAKEFGAALGRLAGGMEGLDVDRRYVADLVIIDPDPSRLDPPVLASGSHSDDEFGSGFAAVRERCQAIAREVKACHKRQAERHAAKLRNIAGGAHAA